MSLVWDAERGEDDVPSLGAGCPVQALLGRGLVAQVRARFSALTWVTRL